MSEIIKPTIELSTVVNIDMRVCKILNAQTIEGKPRLIQLEVDTGDGIVISVCNLGTWLKPEELVGKNMPFILNLPPADFQGFTSHAMLINAFNGSDMYTFDLEIPTGSKIL